VTPSPAGPGGLLPVDKPEGPTSHDIVQHARRALGLRKIGHAGTLDPFASGLLLLCIGAATRLVEFLSDLDKEYLAEAVLGTETDTHDREGEVVRRTPLPEGLGPAEVERALAGFRGELLQRPPRYSAKKVGGEAAHRRVRRGEEVELPAARVTVHRIELVESDLPRIRLRVRCSTGTYVRALARDLGAALGVGAHLSSLRRTRIGPFRVEDALPVEALGEAERVRAVWVSPLEAVAHLPRVRISPAEARLLSAGRAIPLAGPPDGAGPPEGVPLAMALGDRLLAVGERTGASVRPRKVFAHG
jgi:tRNA pseudouridine55 synthase